MSVYNIPPGLPFSDCLARGVLQQWGEEPQQLAQIRIFLPSQRGIRALRESFMQQAKSGVCFLPHIHALGDDISETLTEDMPEFIEDNPEDTQVIAAPCRHLLMARLLMTTAKTRLGIEELNPVQAFALASDLLQILDSLQSERIPTNQLDILDVGNASEHWQKNLDVLKIALEEWPAHLATINKCDPVIQRNANLQSLAQNWQDMPPDWPIIIAGSTGTMPASADLMKIVAHLPKGYVVLPGIDMTLSERCQGVLDWDHPQFGLYRLLRHLDVSTSQIQDWPSCAEFERPFMTSRRRLFQEVMRPSQTTDEWKYLSQRFSQAELKTALQDITLIEAKHDAEEAGVIALILREALETPHQSAALITPNRVLAMRVHAALRRWGVTIDDSAGMCLADTISGVFLRQILDVWQQNFAVLPLLSVLKNPLSQAGLKKGQLAYQVRVLERYILRGAPLSSGLEGIYEALRERYPDDPKALKPLLDKVAAIFAPLNTLPDELDMQTFSYALINVAEQLTASEGGEIGLWQSPEGQALRDLLEVFIQNSAITGCLSKQALAIHIHNYIARLAVRPVQRQHNRLFLWGTPEARLQRTDIVILAGLNEKSWPIVPDSGIWLSRGMRDSLGLSMQERRIGLSAHDFVQAACGSRIFMTYSQMHGDKPGIPSRWLTRMDNLLHSVSPDMASSWRSGQHYADWLERLDKPSPAQKQSIMPPAPCPPTAWRPRRLSVTDIERWRRDPYFIYAKHILKLRRLPSLNEESDPRDCGTWLHELLEMFVRHLPDHYMRAQAGEIMQALQTDLKRKLTDRPLLAGLWQARLQIILDNFLDWHQARFQQGIRVAGVEITGHANIACQAGDFTITGKADRIDRFPGGGLAIIDYKTGSQTITTKQVYCGLAAQLPLLAIIAKQGGFDSMAVSMVQDLCHLYLSGNVQKPLEEISLSHENKVYESLDALIEHTQTNFIKWVDCFDKPTMPYKSRIAVQTLRTYQSDYDHLARVLEWTNSALGHEIEEAL